MVRRSLRRETGSRREGEREREKESVCRSLVQEQQRLARVRETGMRREGRSSVAQHVVAGRGKGGGGRRGGSTNRETGGGPTKEVGGVSMASKPPPIASSLNPNAPVFVPAAYQAAEDFSPEWWQLIQSSTSFREWWMKERFVSEENEQAAAVAARKEEHDFDDIDELLELGFQSGILDDLEDQPSPVAVPQQQQHHLPYQQRQPYYQQQQQQQPLQQQQAQPLQNENLNFLISPSHSFQKFRYGDGAGAGGAQFYRGAVLKEGKPL